LLLVIFSIKFERYCYLQESDAHIILRCCNTPACHLWEFCTEIIAPGAVAQTQTAASESVNFLPF